MRLAPCFAASWLALGLCPAQQAVPTPAQPKNAPLEQHEETAVDRSSNAGGESPRSSYPASTLGNSAVGGSSTRESSAAANQQGQGNGGHHASPVPEPGTLLLVGTGLVGLALTVRRHRRRGIAP